MAETRKTASTGRSARVWARLNGTDVTLHFQTIKGGVVRTYGDLMAGAGFDLLLHPDPVSSITKMQKRQGGYMIEFTDVTVLRH